jgi:uncharacterized protein YqgC (DUF456 family)
VTTVTRAVGAVLVAVGVVAYIATGAESPTALFPAVPGALILVLGLLAARDRLHRHMIHAALVVALLAALASLRMVVDLLRGEVGGAEITSTVTAVVAAVYVGLGVRSFVAARGARESTST